MAATGSARFTWLNRFVNEASILNLARSLMEKALPRAVFRFTVPGPVTMPMPELPQRPMGARSLAGLSPIVQGCPMLQLEVPGQVNAAGLNHWAAVGFETDPLPMRSGCCGRPIRPEPVPEGSPLLKEGLSNGPLWIRKMLLSRQPPNSASVNRLPFDMNLWPRPNGSS